MYVIYSQVEDAYKGDIAYVADPRFAETFHNRATARAFCGAGEQPVLYEQAPNLA
jgi:hypothetical protein